MLWDKEHHKSSHRMGVLGPRTLWTCWASPVCVQQTPKDHSPLALLTTGRLSRGPCQPLCSALQGLALAAILICFLTARPQPHPCPESEPWLFHMAHPVMKD